MRKRCSLSLPSWSRRRDYLSLSLGGKVRLLVGGRDRRKILIAFDGFLPAKFAAGENKDDGNRGDHAADDNIESACVVFHDFHPTSAAARCSGSNMRAESAKIVAEFGPFGGTGLHG